MSVIEFPSPPMGPKSSGRRVVSSGSLLTIGEHSTDLLTVQERNNSLELSHQLSTHEQIDFIPDEILHVLTSTARYDEKAELGHVKKSKLIKEGKVGLRTADQIWHHPLRRSKFKHLIDQPVCMTGAGRDISFLCDALAIEKKNTAISALQPTDRSDMSPQTMEGNIGESIIPKEFYVVKNKGVLGLEYYEDKYTTLLEDDEKKLRLFPSMKPSGRSEVLQLMKVMDNMLMDAGVDEKDIKLEGPSQIHNLLELLKTEQNIYNIVFHELIRQVSVECAERGELLAKLRQRYVSLLDKIPHQVLSLYNDLLAQRALDRSLTEEIIYFKNSIGELTSELYQVREHDLRVSKEAKQAQAELAKALKNAKKNANLLEEYRDLYELQRSRLEKQVVHLTEERDLWSSATYRLARKVIEANQLQLARKMYLCEKAWTKVVLHFLVLLASNDTKDLSEVQQSTEKWREHMARFDQEVKRSEESSREKLQIICRDMKKLHAYFQEKIFVDWNYYAVPDEIVVSVLDDLKTWENMLAEEQQQFEGNKVLSSQESLKAAADIQKEWAHVGEEVLRRHRGLDGTPSPEHKAMADLNNTIEVLCEQYRRRVEGENGVARGLMAFSSSLENWSVPMYGFKYAPSETKESDWSNLYHLLPKWTAQAERLLEIIGSPHSEEKPLLNPNDKLEPEDVFKMLQHWVLNITSGTERDNVQLNQQVTTLHTAMVQYMVNVLILLSPDYSSDPLDTTNTAFGEEDFASPVSVQNVEEQALDLSNKLNSFSIYIMRCCQEMVENIPQSEDDGYELRQLQTIKGSCDEWIETCQLLLSKVADNKAPSEISQHPHTRENKGRTPAKEPSLQNGGTSENYVVKIIGYDGNIHKKSLREDEIPVAHESALQASRPTTPRSMQAFQSLTSLEQLEKRLLHAEMRSQEAEERSENLDEQLKAALQRIQELEIKFQEDEKVEETPAAKEVLNEQIHPPASPKKRPKSSKVKQHK
ncbi:axonemal dynein light chain domain-containing protein 1 isoform X2 [Rana temporaria]|uniref:axonemal dynein light chain domain-containing protein 1 isoform X2 n=1 Tax=Rana temporaria TaxID=8407 RepID=UPI001AACA10E|nr:axonemal dynein light chain domain-containing protein 1 isoform X2 [Rana temporaria]